MIDLPDGRLYLAGEWVTGGGDPITSVFPADGSVNCTLNGASIEDTERAIAAAKAAQAGPAWRGMKPHERARILTRIADGIEANIARIGTIQSRDTGELRVKPVLWRPVRRVRSAIWRLR